MKLLRCLLLVLLLLPFAARAQDDPFAGFAGGFEDIRHAIAALAISGDKQAEPVISALQAGNLYVAPDKSLWIKTGDTVLNARTGETVATPPDDLKKVRVNNAVRGSIDAAMGSLTLFSADPAARRKAAEAVFTGRDPAALPALTRALAQEKD